MGDLSVLQLPESLPLFSSQKNLYFSKLEFTAVIYTKLSWVPGSINIVVLLALFWSSQHVSISDIHHFLIFCRLSSTKKQNGFGTPVVQPFSGPPFRLYNKNQMTTVSSSHRCRKKIKKLGFVMKTYTSLNRDNAQRKRHLQTIELYRFECSDQSQSGLRIWKRNALQIHRTWKLCIL